MLRRYFAPFFDKLDEAEKKEYGVLFMLAYFFLVLPGYAIFWHGDLLVFILKDYAITTNQPLYTMIFESIHCISFVINFIQMSLLIWQFCLLRVFDSLFFWSFALYMLFDAIGHLYVYYIGQDFGTIIVLLSRLTLFGTILFYFWYVRFLFTKNNKLIIMNDKKNDNNIVI